MASILRVVLGLALALAALGDASPGKHREQALVQTWSRQLEGAEGKAADTPVTRVTNLLKELMAQLKADMDEDEKLHCELMVWCNNQEWSKGEAIADTEAKIKFLVSEIERLASLVKQLEAEIIELKSKIKTLKEQLVTTSAQRDKEAGEFKAVEADLIAAIENLRAAIIVLSKHSGQGTLPDLKTERDSWAMLQTRKGGSKDYPWEADHESQDARDFDKYMLKTGVVEEDFSDESKFLKQQGAKFLQAVPPTPKLEEAPKEAETPRQVVSDLQMTAQETMVVQRALASARAYAQHKGRSEYVPGYTAQSGEILGILKQMYEEMHDVDLAGAQKQEKIKIKNFVELRKSIMDQLMACSQQLERKEDEHAQAKLDLANAKEENTQQSIILAELRKYMTALKKMCEEAQKNFDLRKAARMEEIKAVSDTITILMDDDARDKAASTFGESFLQVSSEEIVRRKKAVAILKGAAKKTRNPELLALVTRAENDAFKPVIAAIDKMIAILDTEQADERAKNDWCGDEIQAAEMTTMKKEDHKKDLMAKIEMLDLHIKTLGKEIEEAKTEIANLESGLQRANEDRQKANLDFQKTVADQRATIEVLSKALDKLATYYDGKGDTYTVALQTWKRRAFLQTSTDAASAAPVHDWEKEFAAIGRGAASFVQVSEQRQPTAGSSSSSSSSSTSVTMTVGQTDGFSKVDTTAIAASGSYTMAPSDSGPVDLGAPVAVASFKPNKGAGGVMQFIEKLIYDAKELEKDAIASEVQAQGQYEATVTDTNDTVAELMRSIVEKKAALGEAQKDKTTTESDLFDLMKELEDLSSYSAKLHEECDYYIKNFAARQEARGVELQSLHQAKAILGGATLTQLS